MPSPLLSRRCLLGAALGSILPWRDLPGLPGSRPNFRDALQGYRRTAVFQRHYSVHARVSMLGIPIFSRRNVGGGDASVEAGSAGGTEAVGLQFAAGAWPERAAGLNRFGVMKEAVAGHPLGHPTVSFAGLISDSDEEGLEEARQALRSAEDVMAITMTRGGSTAGRGWVQTEGLGARAPGNWMEADALLAGLLGQESGVPAKELDCAGALPFLETMRRAAVCKEPSFRLPFFHGSRRYLLDARWKDGDPRELRGVIRSTEGRKRSEFRTDYPRGDSSGVPTRIEYQPRAFLKLTFEAVEGASPSAIPSLFQEVER